MIKITIKQQEVTKELHLFSDELNNLANVSKINFFDQKLLSHLFVVFSR